MPSLSVTMIRPKPLKKGAMRAAIIAGAQKCGDDMAKDLTGLTRYWSSGGVKFKAKVIIHRTSVEVKASPAIPSSKQVKIFGYLNDGTPKHPIFPKKAGGSLKFQTGYKAGSRPNSTTVGKSKSFGPTVYRKGVMHPGIKARNWLRHKKNEWKRKQKKYGDAAMKEAAKVSGNYYK